MIPPISPEMLKLAAEKGMESAALNPKAGDIPTFADKKFSDVGSDVLRVEKDSNIPKFAEGGEQAPRMETEDSLPEGSDVNAESDADGVSSDADEASEASDDSPEKNGECLSTYEERLKQTPAEGDRGSWTGERGESKYIPTDEEVKAILAEYGMDGIEYKDGIPDFSKCSEATVEIDNMSSNRNKNFEQCDEKCAEQWNAEARDGKTDWTARDVANWRRENHYSWHECNDRKTCQLVPTKVNDYFGHLGGVGECNIAEKKQEDLFDE